ncbi:uncharacterized protein SPAPADRAFT_135987 [Spathaspora passalidarum NRRL Y-27907]|uniref:TRUD domain-containing protein n=1 Tax=Spathaspora passalidarum (strain NRRL Y-27907 / 11-Y1) TaxID=619300 RepID=G3AM31_SPAPN|nr:uncharacterized protein SPAPADRAFT_135987 [Spathaspora passalidarum NRRL Y-27907]EGW32736.1 hypothetical protein SPAPADRAFT_135987 [Spathaspora passalidarum NRRL Y-27907]
MANTLKRAASTQSNDFSKKSKVTQGLTEPEVGITQFLNPNVVGFTGSIKTLYSDFQVNEIDMTGKVVHLEDDGIDVGKSKKERRLEQRAKEREELEGKSEEEIAEILATRRAEAEAKEKEQEQLPKYTLSDEDKTELLTLITEEELSQVEELFTTGNNFETKSSFDDKQQRGNLHQLFRKAFQGKLETVTTPENTFRIKIATKKSRGHNQNPMDSMHHVDENGIMNYGLGPFKPYLHFTLFKQNRDTMDAGASIARLLRIPSKAISYAGTKDRRGATCQRVSIHRGKVLRVNSLNKGLTNIVLGGFAYEDTGLKLGDLKGNEFLITIRDVASDSGEEVAKVIDRCFQSLRDHGYINYFGMQRFGTFSISSHTLGVHCLKEDWKSCIDLLLSEQESIAPASVEARKVWAETRDPSETLKKLPHFFSAETSILKVLEKEKVKEDGDYNRNAYFKAIMAIPRNLRMLYGHSYQSYIWNIVASKRIELFGLELQEGDLVIVDNEPKPKTDEDDDFEEDVAVSTDTKVKALTKEDIESGKYTIFDVVLPTPGFKVTYPENETLRQVYVDTMAQDGLDPFKMARRIKEFSLPGSYRSILAKAENLTYEIVNYESNEAPLIRTDHEILQLKKQGEVEPKRIVDSQGSKIAVVLKMQLGVSSYATMALREFMRIDTSRMSDSMYKQ